MKKADAVKFFGSENALAKLLTSPRTGRPLTRQTINDWGEVVPIHHAVRLVELTKGKKGALKLEPQDYA